MLLFQNKVEMYWSPPKQIDFFTRPALTRFLAYKHNIGTLFSHCCSITQRFGNTQELLCKDGYSSSSFYKYTTGIEMKQHVHDHIISQ